MEYRVRKVLARRVFFIFTALFLLLTGVSFADGIRIGVFFPAPAVETDAESGPSIGVIRNVLSYYLDIYDGCTAIEFDNYLGDATPENLTKVASDFNLSSIIYLTGGSPLTGISGAALNLYQTASGVTANLSFAEADFSGNTYVEAHPLLVSFLDDLLHISDSWGHVELNSRSSGGAYSVEIDGVFAGDGINRSIAVPAGSHIVTAVQKRPFGEQILLEERVAVQRGSGVALSFAVPELTDLERTAFEAIDSKILGAWETDEKAVEEQFDIVDSLFTGTHSSITVEKYRDKYSTWKKEYSAGKTASKITIETPVENVEREEIAAQIEKDLNLGGAGTGGSGDVTDTIVLGDTHAAPGFGNILLASIGPLLDRSGGLINSLVYDRMFNRDENAQTPFSYTNLTYDVSGEDGVYFWTVLGLWGGAGLAKPLLFPYPKYGLSPGGKVVYAMGTFFDTAGNLLAFISRTAGASRIRAEDILLSGSTAVVSGDPEMYKTVWRITGYSSYGAWALGTTASIIAPLLPGERSAAVSGGFQKVLFSAGSLFNVVGNLASIIAYNARLLVDIRSMAYDLDEFSSGTSNSYKAYETAYVLYLTSTIATYSCWGLGAATSILAVALPDRQKTAGGGVDQTRPEPLFYFVPRVEPDYAGVTVWF